jgi:hypothetical protein
MWFRFVIAEERELRREAGRSRSRCYPHLHYLHSCYDGSYGEGLQEVRTKRIVLTEKTFSVDYKLYRVMSSQNWEERTLAKGNAHTVEREERSSSVTQLSSERAGSFIRLPQGKERSED